MCDSEFKQVQRLEPAENLVWLLTHQIHSSDGFNGLF